MKIKCIKTEKCPICGYKGSIQVFLNKQLKIKYARVRHYIPKGEEGYDADKKYNFRYCRLEDLQQLETLLFSVGFKFPQAPSQFKDVGQKQLDHTTNQAHFGHKDSRFNLVMAGPLGFEPRTFSLEG